MPRWARTFVLLVGTVAYIAIIAVSLLQGQIPSSALVGFLPALWLALNARSTIARKRARKKLDELLHPTDEDDEQEGPAA